MALSSTQFCQSPAAGLMYSFLKPVPKERQEDIRPIQSNDNVLNHLPAAYNQSDTTNLNQSAAYAKTNHEPTDVVDNTQDRIFVNTETTDYLLDSSGDRRKRRKISIEGDCENNEQDVESNIASIELQPSQKGARRSPKSNNHDAPATESPLPNSSVTLKKPRGRPSKSATLKQQALLLKDRVLQTNNASNDEDIMLDVRTSPSTIKRSPRTTTTRTNSAERGPSTTPRATCVQNPQTSKQVKAKAGQGGKKMMLKNGKFATSLVVVLRYSQKLSDPDSTASKVRSILLEPSKSQAHNNHNGTKSKVSPPVDIGTKTTHPFFLTKIAQQGPNASPETQVVLDVKKPIAWKDIVFKTNRLPLTKEVQLDKSPWPCVVYQHIRGNGDDLFNLTPSRQNQKEKKEKLKPVGITDGENVMNAFGLRLSPIGFQQKGVHLPQRLYLSREDAVARLAIDNDQDFSVPVVETARKKALTACSAFDRAEAAGPMSWAQQYSPSTWTEVLQPSCNILYDWLKSLAIHSVKQGLDISQPKRPVKRRKRLKKKDDDLLDFIVSEDEAETELKKVKNAILIVGPNGCGKTAAVYAVAKQLGFEVFEIHSGMRRSQKDILDKVGDMAHNHMVHRGQTLSRDSSVIHDVECASGKDDYSQPPVAGIFASNVKSKSLDIPKTATIPSVKQEQKQSLILFEEVDHLFEDDRGFWSGVQSLIQNSKRPVVLTCNTLDDIPLEELDLHHILTFTAPPIEVVAPYLSLIAAAEGHLIDPKAIEGLYQAKGNDLRATITNLDFWCQMTVGSEKGGLDWYLSTSERTELAAAQKELRTFSATTFRHNLDQYPTELIDFESELQYAVDCLNLEPEDFTPQLANSPNNTHVEQVITALDRTELCSAADVLAPCTKLLLYSQLHKLETENTQALGRDQIGSVSGNQSSTIQNLADFDCLSPLAIERPVFPPSQGRLAPSLDLPRSNIAEDVAPYVRSIALFDQRLEQMREELFSSQGKRTRTTRAARAAVEGGDKASTRRDRWFPHGLDLQAVLATGNGWPQWRNGQVPPEGPASSPYESVESPNGT